MEVECHFSEQYKIVWTILSVLCRSVRVMFPNLALDDLNPPSHPCYRAMTTRP